MTATQVVAGPEGGRVLCKPRPLNLSQFVAAQKRDKKRRNVSVAHPGYPDNSLKYYGFSHYLAGYTILLEKSIVWKGFCGP